MLVRSKNNGALFDDTHRRVYREHYGEIPKGYCIHHIDGNHGNNDPNNLIALHGNLHDKIHGRFRKRLPNRKEVWLIRCGWEMARDFHEKQMVKQGVWSRKTRLRVRRKRRKTNSGNSDFVE